MARRFVGRAEGRRVGRALPVRRFGSVPMMVVTSIFESGVSLTMAARTHDPSPCSSEAVASAADAMSRRKREVSFFALVCDVVRGVEADQVAADLCSFRQPEARAELLQSRTCLRPLLSVSDESFEVAASQRLADLFRELAECHVIDGARALYI